MANEELIFQETSNNDDAILGTLEGCCADFICKTRNGRKYDESLWDKVFSDPIVSEMIENGGIPGELDHPTDREEIDSSRIAILMKEKPKKKDGKLWAKFNILNTPLGRIAHTLAKAGFKLGISSRGSGEVTTDYDGNEIVDESTYDFKCFDLVLLPAVKDARLSLVTESLNKQFNYKKVLQESLSSANEEDRVIMKDALDKLDIDYTTNDGVDIDAINENDKADNDGMDVIKDWQKALKEKKDLELEVKKLKEDLSVCYAKEEQFNEVNQKYNESIEEVSKLKNTNDALRKRISFMSEKFGNLTEKLHTANSTINQLNESLKEFENKEIQQKSTINESIANKDNTIKTLQEEVKSLKESLNETTQSYETKNDKLVESIEDLKKDFSIKNAEYKQKLDKVNGLVEKYKTVAKAAVDKYIQCQALQIGVSKDEIVNKLPSGYSFKDIDTICESLQEYKVNISKLPFDFIGKRDNVRISVKESKEPIKPASRFDDEIDDSLKGLAGIE